MKDSDAPHKPQQRKTSATEQHYGTLIDTAHDAILSGLEATGQ